MVKRMGTKHSPVVTRFQVLGDNGIDYFPLHTGYSILIYLSQAFQASFTLGSLGWSFKPSPPPCPIIASDAKPATSADISQKNKRLVYKQMMALKARYGTQLRLQRRKCIIPQTHSLIEKPRCFCSIKGKKTCTGVIHNSLVKACDASEKLENFTWISCTELIHSGIHSPVCIQQLVRDS